MILSIFFILFFLFDTTIVLAVTSFHTETFGGTVAINPSVFVTVSFGGTATINPSVFVTVSFGGTATIGRYTNWSDIWSFSYTGNFSRPTNVKAQRTTDTSIMLSWDNSPLTEKTIIRCSTTNYPNMHQGTEIYNGTNEYYNHTSLAYSKIYYYSLYGYSNVLGTTIYNSTASNVTAPDIPTNIIQLSNSSSTMWIHWIKGFNASHTLIYYHDGTGNHFCYNGTNTTQLITNLTYSTIYHFLFYSYNLTHNVASTRYTSFTAGTSYTPSPPTNLHITSYNDTRLDLTWTKGSGTHTVIKRKLSSYPANYSDGTTIYSSTSSSYHDTGLNTSTLYYYRAWSYTGSVYSDENISASNYTRPEKPINGSSSFNTVYLSVNLTWNKGNGTNNTIVVKKLTGYPTSITDGTIMQNSTANTTNYYNESGATTTRYYTIFSYSNISRLYSRLGLDIPWGAIAISVFNESKPSQAIRFDLEVSNQAGTIVYTRTNVYNLHYIDMTDIPTGEHVTFLVSNSSYRSRSRDENIELNNFYNYTFYLPLISLPPGEGESENYTRLYRIRVIDQKTDPISDVYTTVKKYINTTDTYQTITTFYTNGYGEYDFWLIPSTRYKVFLEKDGYDPVIGAMWDTDPVFWGANYPKIFQMTTSLTNITIPPDFYNIIRFNGTMFINGSLFVEYMDSYSETIDAQFYMYEVYKFTNTFLDLQSIVGVNSFQYWIHGVNASRQHMVTVHLNHTTLGWVNASIYLSPVNNSLYHDPGIVEDALANVTGPFELGYVRFFIEWLPFIGILVLLGRVEAGMGIFAGTLWLALIGKFFGDLPAELWQVIPIICILAVLWYIATKGKFRL